MEDKEVRVIQISITGGTGFLGKYLYDWIRRNYPYVDVEIGSRRTGMDVRNYEDVKNFVKGSDLVVHAAAQTHVDYSLHNDLEDQLNFVDTNVKGTVHVITACQKYNVKMIHISTSEVYGSNQFPDKPMVEGHPLYAQAGIYATTKACADITCRMTCITKQADIVILRPFNFWGPGQSVEKLIPKMIHQGISNQPLTIYGDGEQSRDYVYIEDVVKAIWMSQKLSGGTIANVATRETVKIKDIAKYISNYFKVKVNKVDPRPGEVHQLIGDYSKFNELTGWAPTTRLEKQSLERVIKWYEANGFIRQPNL